MNKTTPSFDFRIFWSRTAHLNHGSSGPWLDLRLSAPLHEQKPWVVSVELELGWSLKQTAHYEGFVSFCLTILNHSTPKSWYFWCVVKRSRTWALDSNCSFIYPWLDLRLSALLHMNKTLFFVAELIGFWFIMRDSSIHDLDLRLSELLHEQNPFSFSVEFGARFLM